MTYRTCFETPLFEGEVNVRPDLKIEYVYDPTWAMLSLLSDIYNYNDTIIDIPNGAKLKFVDSGFKGVVSVIACAIPDVIEEQMIGVLPIELFQDYSSKGFINWEANYYFEANVRPRVWFELR